MDFFKRMLEISDLLPIPYKQMSLSKCLIFWGQQTRVGVSPAWLSTCLALRTSASQART